MKICPECLLEFRPEMTTCPDCGVELMERSAFSVRAVWPHCANCQTPIAERDMRCSNCGQRFTIMPFSPRLAAFVVAALAYLATGYLMSLLHVDTPTIKIVAVVVGMGTWFVLSRRSNMVEMEAAVPWESISNRARTAMRQSRKNAQ